MLHITIPTIAINVNGSNPPLKRQRFSDWVFKTGKRKKKSSYVMLTRYAPKTKLQGSPENRQMEKEKLANA